MQTLPCSADDTHARWCRWCVFPSIPWPLFVASQRVHRVGQGLPVLLETLLSAFNVRTLSSTGGLLRSTCWLTGQARSVRVCIPEGLRTSFGLTILGRHKARCLTVRLPMPPVRPVREPFASYGSREREIMRKVHFASSIVHSPWTAYAFAGYLCPVSRPAPSGPSPCT